MIKLKRTKNDYFNCFFEGINGKNKVMCILDENCVRYAAFKLTNLNTWRKVKTSEFSNDKKALCFKNATKALNKI